MTDRFAEVRDLEGQIAAKVVEHDRICLNPLRLRRSARLRREIRELHARLRAAIEAA